MEHRINLMTKGKSRLFGSRSPSFELRGLSFLNMGTEMEELLEGHQIFVSFHWGIKYSGKIAKYLIGCKICGMYFRLK